MRRTERILLPLLTFAALVAAWQLAATRGPAAWRMLLPGPLDVARGLAELASAGTLVPDSLASLVRFGGGYLAAVALAVPLGVLFGWYGRAWSAFDPLVQVLRPVSPIAWFPLFSLWFGIGELPALVIIFIAAFYPLLLATVAAVRGVDRTYLKVARNFGASRPAMLTRVVVPAAFPGIAVGLRIALGASWVFLVAGEMLGVQSGLGFLIIDARNSLRTDLVLAGILLIGLLGFAIDRAVGAGERWVRRQWGGA